MLPKTSRKEKSFDVVDSTREFVHGFKLVQTANLEYAYVREADNALLPYRYDVATDFNEYGYAMVGKDARVSWIDKKFRYFDVDEEAFLEEEKSEHDMFNGFLSVSDFSKSDTPLSMLITSINGYSKYVSSYLGIDGKIKDFSYFNGEIINNPFTFHEFFVSTEFNEDGYAISDNDIIPFSGIILFSSGHYVWFKDIINIAKEKGILNDIIKDINKNGKDYDRFLMDVEKNTIQFSLTDDSECTYKIVGIEVRKEELISKYGDRVYKNAVTEVPYRKNSDTNMDEHNFKDSRRKLACLVNEMSTSEVVDLDLFQSLLAKREIPSYIDYEENVFHYNAIRHVKAKK